jgi:hypothetical protein
MQLGIRLYLIPNPISISRKESNLTRDYYLRNKSSMSFIFVLESEVMRFIYCSFSIFEKFYSTNETQNYNLNISFSSSNVYIIHF